MQLHQKTAVHRTSPKLPPLIPYVATIFSRLGKARCPPHQFRCEVTVDKTYLYTHLKVRMMSTFCSSIILPMPWAYWLAWPIMLKVAEPLMHLTREQYKRIGSWIQSYLMISVFLPSPEEKSMKTQFMNFSRRAWSPFNPVETFIDKFQIRA